MISISSSYTRISRLWMRFWSVHGWTSSLCACYVSDIFKRAMKRPLRSYFDVWHGAGLAGALYPRRSRVNLSMQTAVFSKLKTVFCVVNCVLFCLCQNSTLLGSRDGAVVRALAFHQCGPGSIPGPGVVCGLSLLLVFFHAPRVFLRALRFSSLHKNQHHFQIPIRSGRQAFTPEPQTRESWATTPSLWH